MRAPATRVTLAREGESQAQRKKMKRLVRKKAVIRL